MSPARVLSEISGWRDRGRYPLARVVSRWRCVSGGRRRGDRISIGKARRIAVKMALERMNTELARSRVQLGDPA